MAEAPLPLQWNLLSLESAADKSWKPSDTDLLNGALPAEPRLAALIDKGLVGLGLPVLASSSNAALQGRRKAMARQLALQELATLLKNLDPGSEQAQLLLLAFMHVLRRASALVLACGLASQAGAELMGQLAEMHSRLASLPSLTSHLIIACFWDAAGICEMAGRTTDSAQDAVVALEHLASSPAVLEAMLGHLVFAAVSPASLFTRRGLITCTRALRCLFTLQVRGLPHSKAVKDFCTLANLPGRVLQLLALPPATHMPAPHEPWDAAKGQSCGELYTQLLSAAITYVGFGSGIFAAPGGQMTLDGASLASSGAWLLGPGRLESLRVALDTIIHTLYQNKLLDHIECPETRHIDVALRNLLLLLVLPLCCSKRQADVVELVTFSLKYFSTLYRLNFLPLFTLMLHASNPPGPHTPHEGLDPNISEPETAVYYQDGDLQNFFATVSGVMIDALTTVGAAQPDLEAASEEGQADLHAYIKMQLPRVIVWSDITLQAVQESQKAAARGRTMMPYRPATSTAQPPESAQAAGDGPLPTHRRCADCGARTARLLTCQRCNVAVYCGRDCQLAHWASAHRAQCKVLQSQNSVKLPVELPI